jgi:hypothetical protein
VRTASKIERLKNAMLESTKQFDAEGYTSGDMRIALGMLLSATHMVILASAEDKPAAVQVCLSSVDSLVKCLKSDIEALGIENCSIEIHEAKSGEEAH